MTERNTNKDEYDNDLTQKSSTQTCALTPQNEEKTEDEVDNEMAYWMRCDGPCERILELSDLKESECGHSYCEKCIKLIDETKHTISLCPMERKETRQLSVEKSLSDIGCHEGSLSKASRSRNNENIETDSKLETTIKNQVVAEDKTAKGAKSGVRKKHRQKKTRSWYSFLHKNKPLALSMTNDATFGELLKRVATCLEVNLDTHFIDFKIQQSSSESSKEHHPVEVISMGPVSSEKKLVDLKMPKSKMIIIDVTKKLAKKRLFNSYKEDSLDSPSRSETNLRNKVDK